MEDRQFKGVWIPKEIWLNEDLSLLEKVILVEIDSLETEEKGCFATNKYFADFFNKSNGRIAQIINELKDKGYLKIDYILEGKEITERRIYINRPPYPDDIGVFRKLKGGVKFSKGGYLENYIDNNIDINNINRIEERNILKKNLLEDEFEKIWSLYPKKIGKQSAKKSFIKARKEGITYETIENGLNNYNAYIKLKKIKRQFIKQGSSWFNQRNWEDEYTNEDISASNIIENSTEWNKRIGEGFINYGQKRI